MGRVRFGEALRSELTSTPMLTLYDPQAVFTAWEDQEMPNVSRSASGVITSRAEPSILIRPWRDRGFDGRQSTCGIEFGGRDGRRGRSLV